MKSADSEPTDYYWASEPDPERLVEYACSRRNNYFEYFYGTPFFERIDRNWRYHNGLFYGNQGGPMSIRVGGKEDENALIAVNHFRSVAHMLVTYTVQNRPAWDTKASNSDYASMQQAKLGNDILDYYMDQRGVEEYYRRSVEEALIFTAGFVKVTWNEELGDEIAGDVVVDPNDPTKFVPADPSKPRIITSGDIEFENPTIFDVVYDCTARRWNDSPWCLVRSFRNRWELAAKYPEAKDSILDYDSNAKDEFKDYRREQFHHVGLSDSFTDLIDFWEFFHDKTAALPEGRYCAFVGDSPLVEGPLPLWCRRKPLYRIVPAPYLLNSNGYSPMFDLQGPQEALNSEISTIVTNHKNLGPSKIWVKSGETINLADLEPGVTVIQTEEPPQPLQFCQTPREFFQFAENLVQHIEYISGMNAVARGQPQESLRSGTALALVDQKAMQYSSVFQANAYKLLGEIGTAILEIFKVMANTPRMIYIAGVNRRSELREFQKEDLANISRVSVQIGNPLAKTIAGRKEIASELIQNKLIKTPEEYLSVLETGQLRPLTETDDAENSTTRDENEKLKNGQPVAALITDYHVFHLLKHKAILDSTEMRQHPIIAPSVLAHMKEHIAFLVNPECQWYQQAMGYPCPLPAMLMAGPPQPGMNPTNAPPGQEGMSLPEGNPMPVEASMEAQSAAMEAAPER